MLCVGFTLKTLDPKSNRVAKQPMKSHDKLCLVVIMAIAAICWALMTKGCALKSAGLLGFYVYVCTCMCVYIYIYIYIYTHTYIYI